MSYTPQCIFYGLDILISDLKHTFHVKQKNLYTVFPRLERTRSINFILLPRGGLYEMHVVIGGTFY